MKATIAVLALIVVLLGIVVALDRTDSAKNPANTGTTTECPITQFNNGVYYFGCNKATFGRALSEFKGKLTQRERIVQVAPDDAHGYGFTDGYFVVTETN